MKKYTTSNYSSKRYHRIVLFHANRLGIKYGEIDNSKDRRLTRLTRNKKYYI